MPLFALENLTKQTVAECAPWEFKAELPSEKVRSDKAERQRWHKSPATVWNYYTGFEGHAANQRLSKENPPRLLHAFTPEFDLPITIERVNEAIASWKIKPAYVERSLGGNLRLVFLLPRTLAVDSTDFATFLLERAVDWLALNMLPGLDQPAFVDPMRLLCNGANWTCTGYGPIPEEALQAFFVESARKFRFTPLESAVIPLDLVEKTLKEKFPGFTWPGPFEPESSGPSFWVPGSQSSNSAILKPDGFLTFSAHATKPFYNWSDLLGPEFVKGVKDTAIAKATMDIWHDGKKFFRKKNGVYVGIEKDEVLNHLQVDCGITKKILDETLSHIYNHNYIESAGPFLFRPPGLMLYAGKRRLNTASTQVVQPATGSQTWGGTGNFSFISAVLDNLFTTEVQRNHFLAWWQYFYNAGLHFLPTPGQALFILGGVATGKTFTSRELVGRSVGGYCDASGYILRGSEFQSHLFESALWVMDDDTISDSPQAAQNVQSMLKKSVANTSFLSNRKFQVSGMLDWMGRIVCTANVDYLSSRILAPLDQSSMDKVSVFRAEAVSKLKFPSRHEIEKLTTAQLPFFLRWLSEWNPPDYIERDSRFGYKSYHDSSLMSMAGQSSRGASFKELLMQTMQEFFQREPTATEWRGNTVALVQMLHFNPLNEAVIRTFRLDQVARYLETIQHEGSMQCRTENGPLNTRIWVFPRLTVEPSAEPPQQLAEPATPSPFVKQ